MKKRRIRAAVFCCAFLMFLFLMDYPYLSRLYNDAISGRVAASLEKREENAICRRRLIQARAFNRGLAQEETFPNASQTQGGKKDWMKSARVLCLEESDLAGWIRIPSLELLLPLVIGTGDKALEQGAGILEGSSLPVGGKSTHTCISAHRGLPDHTLFTNLDMLKNKDRIEVHTLGRSLFYEVFGQETVLPSDTRSLAILPGQDLLTLITCTPYGINSHRLYVHAKRCSDSPAPGSAERASFFQSLPGRLISPVFWKLWWWIPATCMLILLLILVVRRSFR